MGEVRVVEGAEPSSSSIELRGSCSCRECTRCSSDLASFVFDLECLCLRCEELSSPLWLVFESMLLDLHRYWRSAQAKDVAPLKVFSID